MSNSIGISPADILLPQDCGLSKWAVVACDQYTSQPEYWERVDQYVGDAPSTLRLILPESRLEGEHVQEDIQQIQETMRRYLEEDQRFFTLENSYLYVERRLSNGKLRKGLMVKVDLEQYSYEPGADALIRATEGTVLSRIPPRMAVRRGAPIELPHIMVLMDDPDNTVLGPLGGKDAEKTMQRIYSCTLMEDGGRLTGWNLNEQQREKVDAAVEKLADSKRFEEYYHAPGRPVLLFAIGDGNHSLATAKACWEEQKKDVPEAEWADHPARYALVELVNLHDESLEFEAIHRVVFETDPATLLSGLLAAYPGAHEGEGEGHQIRYLYGDKEGVVTVPNPQAQLAVGTLQNFLDAWLAQHGGKVDYIHGEDVVRSLSVKPNSIGFLLPAMEKGQLYPTVIFDGVLPRKTFSMGEAQDKRFYMEARKIK